MGDSDDEGRGERRSKFARERSDSERGMMKRSGRYHDDYHEGGRREKRRPPSPTFSRGGRADSPPLYGHGSKRMKREHWESLNDFPPGGHGGPGMMMPGPWIPGGRDMRSRIPPAFPRSGARGPRDDMRPPSSNMLLSFKQFLAQQSDAIDEVEAVERYAEYKNEFRKKQVEEFFDKHKDEEWFKVKYHPKELEKQKEIGEAHLKSRLTAFNELLTLGWLSDNPLEMQNQDYIVKTMDAATILMEGGSSYDLSVLDSKELEEGMKTKGGFEAEKRKTGHDTKKKSMNFVSDELTPEQKQLQQQAQKYKKMRMSHDQDGEDEKGDSPKGDEDDDDGNDSINDGDDDDRKDEEDPTEGDEEEVDQSAGEEDEPALPRPLHLTRSVYVKKVPPTINTEDIEQVCRTIPGYLRLAFSDPVPEKDYERRCWVTFEHTTNIREVIARLTANPIKGQTLECSTNRDLPRRVKLGSKASYVRRAVTSDIKLAKKLIEYFDNKAGLWQEAIAPPQKVDEGDDNSDDIGVIQTNPVLENVPLLEEEDTEGTGEVGDKMEDEEEGIIGVNPADTKEAGVKLLECLDMMLWYLRIVHSVDFYGNSSVPSEDLMPHRCGIITARNSKGSHHLHQDEVDEYILSMEKNLEVLVRENDSLKPDEVEKLGKKAYDIEVEKFIEKNTEKISDEKYHCPLSGKKFKAPEFVRKHIFNKHMEKVEAVKLEVDCYNNYLRDSERPMPETITSTVTTPTGLGGGMGRGMQGPPEMMGWMQPPPGVMFGQGMYPPFGGPGMMGAGRGGRPSRGSGRGRGSGRSTVSYRDLDNPAEMDF